MVRLAAAQLSRRTDRRIYPVEWFSVHALAAAGLVALLMCTGAPLGTALLGAWLMSGLVTLALVDAALATQR